METTDYVSYPVALALKKAGFNEPCEAFYEHIDGKMWLSVDGKEDWNSGVDYSAPTLWQAQKWLREKKDIVVVAEPDWDEEIQCLSDYLTGKWYFSVWKDNNRIHCNFNPNIGEEKIWMFDTYEQALSAGIAAALELIEEKGE